MPNLDVPPPTASAVEKVAGVLQAFATGWRDANSALLKSTWDSEYPNLTYIASERLQPLSGYEEVCRYYDDTLSAFTIKSVEIDDVRIDVFGEFAHAFCSVHMGWAYQHLDRVDHPRATFVLRKRDGQWRVIHYHESIKWEFPS